MTRGSSRQCRLTHCLFPGNAALKTVAVALLLASLCVFVSSFTLDGAGRGRKVYAAEGADQGVDDSSLGDIKLAGAGQQQLLNQLKKELGTDDADLSLLERQHGVSEVENAVLRDAVPGMSGDLEDEERDSASEEADEDASGSAENDSASFVESGEAEDADNFEKEGDTEMNDSDDEAAGSFVEDDPDQESDAAYDSGSASFVEGEDTASEEASDSDAYHDEPEDEEEEAATLADPYGATPVSYLQEDADDNDVEFEEEPSSFIQVGATDRLIKKHAHQNRQLAHDRPASAFNQDRIRLRLADQTAVEDELLNEASDLEGGQGVVSPTDDGAAEGEGSATDADSIAAEMKGPPMEENGQEPVALAGEAESAEESLSSEEAPVLQEGMPSGGSAEETAEPVVATPEKAPGALDVDAAEVAPARAPEAETVEGTAAQIVEEMSKQDQGVEESRPQEVLSRGPANKRRLEYVIRAKKSDQTAVAVASVSLVGLSVAYQFLFSV
ncbi:rhoptry protein ROP6 [Besnoitia besnoiti]|uniref:Rhoptry protein ROP6 n=1 Tax=Besnoitia besnoiti TaxID=94643 RepID=A0A2A9MBF7_BESBE|nr:rhoptry protein ROP6 [Besnoitia besnoiti]PFH33256.1 rhoptry protein ROP6 [Besnoitia besnoiti]